ncbi:uncharacterized protein LOC127006889 [Eriocheir sinensis]|uniref:uncharacterized protein LOC127006889 n=1 Tax=Eriocheir sinensis TaxID=95602 RepID=UPI0021C581B6|nr:uncharacterized protein LOC127006889 [Eriocheir sinensis]XP_050733185.1 uncharacterized protein LOC127006889 [Eriocheir sinensis]
MRGRKLFLNGIVAAVLLLTLALLHGGTLPRAWVPESSRTRPPQARRRRVEVAPPHPSVAAGSRAPHGNNCSATAQTHLEEEFERRRRALRRACSRHDARAAYPDMAWRQKYRHVLAGTLTLFKVPKAGSTAVKDFVSRLAQQTPATPRPLSAVVVRHPLARLASTYRDKYLGGAPLFQYDAAWRKASQSSEEWGWRFAKYWLPALVSTGALEQSRKFNETSDKIRRAYKIYMNHYASQTGALLARPSSNEELFYGGAEMFTAHQMLSSGISTAFVKTFGSGSYDLQDLATRFGNTSFTFSQFLRHVVWTHDAGVADEHWMTYTEACDPCRVKFDYILKLETIQEEVQHLFCGVLGFQGEAGSFPVRHRSHGHALTRSDREHYASVSTDLMRRLLGIYRHDFAIFDYSQGL